ncbi:uncharacterized protein LOC141784475 [Halichoeres trimaculatus]|uniref:uncharacterized protein LOC141784475 n=1 Tax=Halichoeres trimaculatus TaxID=147232 RepID=UPI003D9E3084
MAQSAGQKSSSAVHQESGVVSADVGGKITLRCFYEGDVSTKFYWYKQTLGEKPKLVSSYFRYAESKLFHGEFENNPRFTLDSNTGQNRLRITDLHVSDTATYYCVYKNSGVLEFLEGISLIVGVSGLDFEVLVNQSGPETIQPGSSVTLSCTIHTGSCDGEQSVYWFKHSEESQPGLIYIHGEENDQCQRKPDQQSCEFILPMQSLNLSHVGIYYCAVVSCGHILFGNGTRISFKDDESSPLLVYLLSGALAFTIMLVVFLVSSTNTCRDDGTNSCQCADVALLPPEAKHALRRPSTLGI